MLSMGFADDVERIFGECPAGKAKGMGSSGSAPVDDAFDLDELLGEEAPPAPVAEGRRPQTLLFSATSPGWIKKMTRKVHDGPRVRGCGW